MDAEPIIEFKGTNGRIELHKNFVRIDRETVMGFIFHGLKGKKDIYFKNITSIQIKKPGLSTGYMQFSLPGGIEAVGGASNAIKDENTISFNGQGNYEKALKIKEYIEKENIPSSSPTYSSADEIEKLHALMEKGIITQKEFEQKKKDLLGK